MISSDAQIEAILQRWDGELLVTPADQLSGSWLVIATARSQEH